MRKPSPDWNGLKRLRDGDKICGYSRDENGVPFYSKDLFWWNGHALPFTESDAWVGHRDDNDRPLFVNDIITVKSGRWFPRSRAYRVAEERGNFVLVDLQVGLRSSVDILKKARKVRFLSFTFLNPDLSDTAPMN